MLLNLVEGKMKRKFTMIFILFLFLAGIALSQSITVTSPHSGNIWYRGSSYTITWTHTGNMNEYVKIRLYQGDKKILEIVNSTSNNGSYRWRVPESLQEGEYYVRVKTVDNAVYDDGEIFKIMENSSQSPSYIKLITPRDGEVWKLNSKEEISWESHYMSPDISVYLEDELTHTQRRLVTFPNSEGKNSFKFLIKRTMDNQLIKPGDYRLFISDDLHNFSTPPRKIKIIKGSGINNKTGVWIERFFYDRLYGRVVVTISTSRKFTGRVNYSFYIKPTPVMNFTPQKIEGYVNFHNSNSESFNLYIPSHACPEAVHFNPYPTCCKLVLEISPGRKGDFYVLKTKSTKKFVYCSARGLVFMKVEAKIGNAWKKIKDGNKYSYSFFISNNLSLNQSEKRKRALKIPIRAKVGNFNYKEISNIKCSIRINRSVFPLYPQNITLFPSEYKIFTGTITIKPSKIPQQVVFSCTRSYGFYFDIE